MSESSEQLEAWAWKSKERLEVLEQRVKALEAMAQTVAVREPQGKKVWLVFDKEEDDLPSLASDLGAAREVLLERRDFLGPMPFIREAILLGRVE